MDPGAAGRLVDLASDVEAAVPVPLSDEVLARVRALETRGDRGAFAALERTLASEGVRLPPLPRTVLRIQRLVDDPDCSPARLDAEILRDPALAIRLVAIANSPFYAGLGPCRAVPDAIVRIGMRETRNLVTAIVVQSRVLRVPGFEAHTEALADHALAAALSGHALAASIGADPDLGFVGGLLHDVGRAVFLLAAGDARRAHPALRADSGVVEQGAAELHGLLGALVARSWQLGDDLADAIRWHHEPERAPESSRAVARLLRAADALAWRVAGDASSASASSLADACRALGVEADERDALAEEVAHAYETLRKAL